MTEPVSSQICAAWATEADLPDDKPALPAGRWTELLIVASEILWALSGRRWSGVGCEVSAELRMPPHPNDGYWPGGSPLLGLGTLSDVLPLNVPRDAALKLPHDEVTGVVSVTIGAEAFTDFYRRDSWLIRTDGRGWSTACGGETVTIVYQWGEAPPAGGKRAAVLYALELGKAEVGDSSCRLPKRVVSVVRQGVSMTLIDPQQYLENGKLGMPDIDQWLASVNPQGLAERGGVWSPDVPRAHVVP